jgi:ketosteroid isomerase-like protein
MYHAIVRKRIRGLFAAVNDGDAEPVLQAFGPRFEHAFLGEHALGGPRKTLAATRLWYQRLYRLLPGIRFDLRDIAVNGGPRNTLVLVEWDETNAGADGVRTYNHGVHAMHLRWGRATRLLICPDTAGLKATLDRLALAGFPEAHAGPITDG